MNVPLLIGVTIFVVVAVAIPTAILGLRRWGERRPIAWVSKWLGATDLLRELIDAPTERLGSPRLLIQTVGFQLAIFTFDTRTLWLVFNERIRGHAQFARRVCRSGAGRDALAAWNDVLAADVARRLACTTRDWTRLVALPKAQRRPALT